MNNNLHKAKKEKNDEFYTLLSDIEKELQHYQQHFKGKIVYSNCDSPESNFVKYFTENKDRLGIKEFYHTWYNKETGEGSFDSEENIKLLKKADIVVTNPPFSLFRDFLSLLTTPNKKFIIVGATGAITYKDCFKMIKEGRLWLGVNYPKEFLQPDKSIKKFGNISWFTNLEHNNRNKELVLTKEYNPIDYPKYDNYDAIEVSRVANIPKNYEGVMGVPISFLTKWNPNQFDIVEDYAMRPTIKDKAVYRRLLIKHKQLNIK